MDYKYFSVDSSNIDSHLDILNQITKIKSELVLSNFRDQEATRKVTIMDKTFDLPDGVVIGEFSIINFSNTDLKPDFVDSINSQIYKYKKLNEQLEKLIGKLLD